MSTYYKDLNYELTQHNQRMRMELCSYRNEMIKVRHDLMKQREENAALKRSLTSEFLKVSRSFNIIFRLLENTCNESVEETITSLNNSITNLNNTNYGEEKNIDGTIVSSRRDNIGRAATIEKDSDSIDDASLSNFSFEVENEETETTIVEQVDMNISNDQATEPDPDVESNEDVLDKEVEDDSAMTIIEEECEDSEPEPSICCTNTEFIAQNNSSIVEESFIMPTSAALFRSTSIPKQAAEILSPSNISLRNCSVLLHKIKTEPSIVQPRRSSFKNITTTLEILKDENLSIKSEENVENLDNGKKLRKKQKQLTKSPERRVPVRKAAPKVLTEQNNKFKMRRL